MELFQKQAERFGAKVLLEDAPSVVLDRAALPRRDRGAALHRRRADRRAPAPPRAGSGSTSETRLQQPGRVGVRDLRRRAVPRQADGGGGRRRHRDGGGAVPDALRDEGDGGPPPRGELRASKIMQERARRHEKIEFAWNAEVGGGARRRLRDGRAAPRHPRAARSASCRSRRVFVAIGHQPNTELFRGQIALDATGYIQVAPGTHAHDPRGRVRVRRRDGSDLPAGGHRRRHRLHGGDRRRALARGARA